MTIVDIVLDIFMMIIGTYNKIFSIHIRFHSLRLYFIVMDEILIGSIRWCFFNKSRFALHGGMEDILNSLRICYKEVVGGKSK